MGLVQLSLQSTDDGFPPEITLQELDVEVDEEEDKRIQLGSGGPVLSCSDPFDGDPSRAYIQSVSPSSPCGARCFELEPCGIFGADSNATTDWCLFYLASQGDFVYSVAPRYTVNIACTDDVEVPATTTMTVTVRPNTPPVFVPSSPLSVLQTINGLSTTKGTTLYDIVTDDIDLDPVYYTLSTNPSTDYLEIVYTGGTIKTTNNLRFFCEDKLTASVMAQDPFNPAIGPFTLELTLNPYNAPPVVNNLDTTVTVDENVGVGFTVLDLDVVDNTVYTDTYFNLRSSSQNGIEMYELVGTKLVTRIDPDYERTDTRRVRLFFDVDDGYCQGETYFLYVEINDVAETPAFSADNSFIEVYEGDIDTPYGLYIIDDDSSDTFTYALSRTNSFFGVNSATGNIYSLSEIDIDTNTLYQDFDVYMTATDSGGLSTQELHVVLRVYDVNDNPPYFNSPPYVVAATDCTDPGSVLGTVEGTDDDSDYNQNNQIYYGGSGGKFAVMATGEIVLTEACSDGEGFTGSATIADQGIYPGPLSGTSATVTLTCGPCPAFTVSPGGTATTTAATTTAAPTTTVSTDTSNDSGGLTEMLPWMIPAILLGLLWLALTIYLCWRFCRNPCPKAFEPRPKKVRVVPKPKPPDPVPPPPQYKPPPPPPPKPKTPLPPPPPPPPRQPTPAPYVLGFWKETYTDQDQKQPAKAEKPKAVEDMPAGVGNEPPPQHLKLGSGGKEAIPSFLPGRTEPQVNPAKPPTPETPPRKKKWFCRP